MFVSLVMFVPGEHYKYMYIHVSGALEAQSSSARP